MARKHRIEAPIVAPIPEVLDEPSILMDAPPPTDSAESEMFKLQQTLHRIEHKLDFLIAEKRDADVKEITHSVCVTHT